MLEILIWRKSFTDPPNQKTMELCFQNYICPDHFQVFIENFYILIERQLSAENKGILRFDELGTHISNNDIPKDVDEFLLGMRHGNRLILYAYGALRTEIIESDPYFIMAKQLTESKKEENIIKSELLGIEPLDLFSYYLTQIYLKHRIEKLCI